MSEKYILATRHMMLWHFQRIDPYLRYKYTVLQSVHSSANMEKKSTSTAQFLFGDITKELEAELKEFQFEVLYKDRLINIK